MPFSNLKSWKLTGDKGNRSGCCTELATIEEIDKTALFNKFNFFLVIIFLLNHLFFFVLLILP